MDADLVLEGGGVKGIALVGAYSVLQEAGYRIHRVAGTSAGAIVGSLIAADMPLDDMHQVMRTIDYHDFEDKGLLDHLGLIGQGLSLLFEKGIYEGKYLRTWLDDTLTDLGKRTFGDLRVDDPGSSLPKDKSYRLVVTASDITRGRLVKFPWDYPDYQLKADTEAVADAVRASASIPFFFEPVHLKYRGDTGTPADSYLVDGGMLSNFPIEIFDRSDGKTPRWPTFGIKLSAKPASTQQQKFDVDGPIGFCRALIGTMTNFHDQMHIDDPSVTDRVIFVDTGHVKATDFDLDEATQTMLYENGRTAATKFLSTWNFDEYIRRHRSDPDADGSDR